MIVIREVQQVEVTTDEGAIFITQTDHMNDNDAVMIYAEHIDRLIGALSAAKVEAEAWQAKQGESDA